MGKPLRVLFVEDMKIDALLTVRELKRSDYDVTFERVETAEAMNAALDRQAWDIVICDHVMPLFTSSGALKLLQEKGLDLPFIIVSGCIGEETAVAAMKAGAHDYIMKDNLTRLPAAIERELGEAEVRRQRKEAEEEAIITLVQLRKSLEDTVYALASAVEQRDPYTSGHQRMVARLACAIAGEMGLPQEQIHGLRLAGIVHDIGKISVPAEILSKPTRLAELEFSIIKTHTRIGYDILKGIEFPWPVAKIVFQHHERLDGSGYPQGISGEDILLEARILGVADVIGAMASHRPYRPSLGIDKALEEISQESGSVYDPRAVDACVKLFTEKGYQLE